MKGGGRLVQVQKASPSGWLELTLAKKTLLPNEGTVLRDLLLPRRPGATGSESPSGDHDTLEGQQR